MTDNSSDLRTRMAALAGVTPDSEQAALTTDILSRARWARNHNDGHPKGAWSTGEQLAVALVLDDTEHLTAMGYTPAEAADRVAGGMYFPPANITTWLADLRTQLTDEGE